MLNAFANINKNGIFFLVIILTLINKPLAVFEHISSRNPFHTITVWRLNMALERPSSLTQTTHTPLVLETGVPDYEIVAMCTNRCSYIGSI